MTPLPASAAVALGSAALYALVALAFFRRPVTDDHAPALRLFAFWWATVSANLVLSGAGMIVASLGARDLALFVAQAYLERTILAFGLWALLCYFGFLLTGDRRTWAPLGAYYALYYVATVWRFAAGRPWTLDVRAWGRPVLVPSVPASTASGLLVLAAFVVPPLVACLLYLPLARRARDATQRRRIVVTAGGIVGWLLLGVVGYVSSDSILPQLVGRVAALAIAASILAVTTSRSQLPARPSPSAAPAREG